MKSRNTLGAACALLLCLTLSADASAQCSSASEDEPAAESVWRHRLAAWVPNITFELSNEFDRQANGLRRARPIEQPEKHLGLPARAAWRDSFGRQLDWQVAAHWDVVELVESLSPLPQSEFGDVEACDETDGGPAHLNYEEDP
jgi:hypothetical protein